MTSRKAVVILRHMLPEVYFARTCHGCGRRRYPNPSSFEEAKALDWKNLWWCDRCQALAALGGERLVDLEVPRPPVRLSPSADSGVDEP